MLPYRFYMLDPNGKILSGQDHICADDLVALDKAKELSGDTEIEVWQFDRRVARVKKGDENLRTRDQRSL